MRSSQALSAMSEANITAELCYGHHRDPELSPHSANSNRRAVAVPLWIQHKSVNLRDGASIAASAGPAFRAGPGQRCSGQYALAAMPANFAACSTVNPGLVVRTALTVSIGERPLSMSSHTALPAAIARSGPRWLRPACSSAARNPASLPERSACAGAARPTAAAMLASTSKLFMAVILAARRLQPCYRCFTILERNVKSVLPARSLVSRSFQAAPFRGRAVGMTSVAPQRELTVTTLTYSSNYLA